MKIICVMVTTADGIPSRPSQENVDGSSKQDKAMFTKLTQACGVVIVGSATYNAIGRPLPGRLNIVMTRTPEKYADQEKKGELEFVSGLPHEILNLLHQRGFETVALIGGPHLNAAFFKTGLVDELYLTIEPKIFGAGINFIEGKPLDLELSLKETTNLTDNVLLLHYAVIKK